MEGTHENVYFILFTILIFFTSGRRSEGSEKRFKREEMFLRQKKLRLISNTNTALHSHTGSYGKSYIEMEILELASDKFGDSVITNRQLPECKMFPFKTYLAQFTDISHSDDRSRVLQCYNAEAIHYNVSAFTIIPYKDKYSRRTRPFI